MRLATEGNVITKPEDIIKQPTVLEFLGMEEKAKYSETDLETALINKLQKFLLELGKGYLFEARQKRFTYDEDNFYVDLVFYNRLLRCYVLIDLKVDKLTHQDIGQMQMYVNYYDKFEFIGKIHLNSQWDDIRHGENDCTLLYENYAIVFEDKSGRVNRNTHKGLLNSAYRDNKKLIEESSGQATDFANLLMKNLGKELTLKVKGGGQNVIDLKRIKHVLNVGVVFEETALQNISLGGKKHSPIVSIFQLNKIFECLEAWEIVDYFIKRSQIERNISYQADEYDLLYTYLKNGLNTSEKIYIEADEKEMLLIQYTEEKLTRADLERENWFQVILNSVIEQAEENWLDIIISMLGIPPVVQRQVIRDIFKEKKLDLIDNIKYRNKAVLVDLLEYFDCDTGKEIEEKIENYSNFSEIIYIAFTEKFEHIIVKLKKC